MIKKLTPLIKTYLIKYYTKLFGIKGEIKNIYKSTAQLKRSKLSKDDCKKIIQIMDNIIINNPDDKVWSDQFESDVRIFNFEKYIGDYLEKFEVDRWIEAVNLYLGRNCKSWCLMANRIKPMKGNLGSGGGFHRDSPYSHQVKFIWYLTDVSSDNGPFEYLPMSHRDFAKQKGRSLGDLRFSKVEEDVVEVTADSGSLLICDTLCIHRGKPIKSGVRYAITLYTMPTNTGIKKLLSDSGLNPY